MSALWLEKEGRREKERGPGREGADGFGFMPEAGRDGGERR